MNKHSSKQNPRILAIETSCDETSASVVEIESLNAKNLKLKILSNIVSSQIKLHKKYGGVYPELASREHVKNILPVLDQALEYFFKHNHKKPSSLASYIDYVAITTKPGLIGSLLVGTTTTQALSFATGIPIIPINHLEGHIYANFIDTNPTFPILSLVVSGGHTSLYYIKDHMSFKLIGETIDDAAGEAYDKVSKMLGLGYPGGPIIDAKASQFANCDLNKNCKLKIENSHLFPRPMLNSKDFNFSFSGLKTSVLYYLKNRKITPKLQNKVAYEFQEAVTDVLVVKTIRAAKKYKVKSVLLCGGVAANSRLREKMRVVLSSPHKQTKQVQESQAKIKNHKLKINLYVPPIKYCTDNAAMIAAAAAYKIKSLRHHSPSKSLNKEGKLLKEKPVKWYDIEAKSSKDL